MNQDHKELAQKVLSFISENNPLLPPLLHGMATANLFEICNIVACMLEGMSQKEIMDWLAGYQDDTAMRFYKKAEIFHEIIVKQCPDQFSEYLLPKTKNVTSKKKKLPKGSVPLRSGQFSKIGFHPVHSLLAMPKDEANSLGVR